MNYFWSHGLNCVLQITYMGVENTEIDKMPILDIGQC